MKRAGLFLRELCAGIVPWSARNGCATAGETDGLMPRRLFAWTVVRHRCAGAVRVPRSESNSAHTSPREQLVGETTEARARYGQSRSRCGWWKPAPARCAQW